jgi:hypothetical protein
VQIDAEIATDFVAQEAMKVLHQLTNRVRPKGVAKISGKDRTTAWLRLLGITVSPLIL